jgi:sporulation protein YlmC with PRC-barrel domain
MRDVAEFSHRMRNLPQPGTLFWQTNRRSPCGSAVASVVHQSGPATEADIAADTKDTTMKRIALIASVAAATFAGAAAIAQTTAPAPSPPVASPPSAPMSPSATDPFYTSQMTPTSWRTSEVIGKPVYTRQDERIGEVDELLINAEGRVVAAVVGVGGFLGIGERKVALSYPAIRMTRDDRNNGKFVVELSKESLKAAPEYTAPKTN